MFMSRSPRAPSKAKAKRRPTAKHKRKTQSVGAHPVNYRPVSDGKCEGTCVGMGVAYELEESGPCDNAAAPSALVVNEAKRRAKEFAEGYCTSQDKNCSCEGRFHRIAQGAMTVADESGQSCVTYAIYLYKGRCGYWA
jgi:hypothetical protein